MKISAPFFVLLFVVATTLPTAGFAETDTWPGPEWRTASCPFNNQTVSVEGHALLDSHTDTWRKTRVTSTHHTGDYENYHFRWWPMDAEAEVLCGEKFIVLATNDDIVVDVLIPTTT